VESPAVQARAKAQAFATQGAAAVKVDEWEEF
jgi:hypothetical protein